MAENAISLNIKPLMLGLIQKGDILHLLLNINQLGMAMRTNKGDPK